MRSENVGRTILRELLTGLFYVVASVGMTWPLARFLDRAVTDPGDPLLNTWILHWNYHATFSSTALFEANIFHPARLVLAFSENIYGIALFTFPLQAAGLEPLVVYNLALIMGFASAGYGAHVLARLLLVQADVEKKMASGLAILSGLFFAFVPYRFDQMSHLQHLWTVWIALHLAAVAWCLRRPSVGRAVLVGVTFFLNGLTNIHWLLFVVPVAPLFALILWTLSPAPDRPSPGSVALTLFSGWIVGGSLLLPLLLPYSEVRDLYGFERSVGETAYYSAEPGDWLVPPIRARIWDEPVVPGKSGERRLFPGVVALALSFAGLFWVSRRELSTKNEERARGSVRWLDTTILVLLAASLAGLVHGSVGGGSEVTRIGWDAIPRVLLVVVAILRLWIRIPGSNFGVGAFLRKRGVPPLVVAGLALVLMGYWLSLGLNGAAHGFLYAAFEPFRALRVPARWAIISYLGMSLLIPAGVLSLLRFWRLGATGGRIAVLVAGVLLLTESNAAPVDWSMIDETAPVYHWLDTAPLSGAVLELPMTKERSYDYVYRSIEHFKPLVNGVSGFETPTHRDLTQAFSSSEISERLIEGLETLGISTLVVHDENFGISPAIRNWLARAIESGVLAPVDNFPHGVGGDYVFAVTANEPNLGRIRSVEIDPAGRTLSERFEVFLKGGVNYRGGTFGEIYFPTPWEEAPGLLTVDGWAFSEYGIESVRLLFERQTVTIEATRSEDASLRERFPWYEETMNPSFATRITNRPAGVSRETDLVVEITDGRGEVTQLPRVSFRWRRLRSVPTAAELSPLARRELFSRLGIRDPAADTVSLVDLIEPLLEGLGPLESDQFVTLAYETLFERTPAPPEVAEQSARLTHGHTRLDLVRQLLASKEFAQKYGVVGD